MRLSYYPIIALLIFYFHNAAYAQKTGTIRGAVRTSDGQPAAYVNVVLDSVGKGTVTRSSGRYEIARVPQGRYKLTASFVGLVRQEQWISVFSGDTTVVDFTMAEDAAALQEIVISGRRAVSESGYVARMPLKNLENPQVYNTVGASLMQEQAITNFDDALRNVPGIYKMWEATGRAYGDGASYYSLRGFEVQPTMVNGLPGLTNGTLDPSNIERIEVIKGPSSTLFGSSLVSYGGLINTVTKKPYAGFGGEIGVLAGSFGLTRITADVNVPLTAEGNTVVRVNTAWQDEGSFQDAGFRKLFYIGPTIAHKVNDRLSFMLVTEFMNEERTNPSMIFLGRDTPLYFENLDELGYDPEKSFTSNDLTIRNPRMNLQAQANYKLSTQWTSQTTLSRGTAQSDGYYIYLYDNENGTGQFGLWASLQNGRTTTTDIQQNFVGNFMLGNMRNRLLVGIDYFQRGLVNNSSGFEWIYNIDMAGALDFVHPFTGEVVGERYLTRASIDNVLASSSPSASTTRERTYSAYVSDVINLTPRLLAMASVRMDYFDTDGDIDNDEDDYDQAFLSPKFGLVYQVVRDKVSAFANYMNGFTNISPQVVYDDDGNVTGTETFEPEHANQLEFGVKASVGEELHATLSYYNIRVEDVVVSIPGTYNVAQGGAVRSKGIEVDVNASPTKGLALIIGYAYNDSKVVDGDVGNVFLEEGKRPVDGGPRHLFNTWITYTLQNGRARGLGAGVGGNRVSELAIIEGSIPGKFTLPGYTLANATLFYNHPRFRIALNVNNVADKEYYSGYTSVNAQKPRNAVVSFAYKF